MNDTYPSVRGLRVCWIGGTRYTNPLDATQDKKWRLLRDQLGIEIAVVSFAHGLRPQVFAPHARFYLLPALPVSLLRYATMFILGPLVLLWLIVRRGVRVIVTHDPYFGWIGAVAKGIARLFGVRAALVIESHADFEAVFLQRKVPFTPVLRLLMHWTVRQSIRRADALRAVSSNTRQQLSAYAPAGVHIHQFLTWTDSEAFQAAPREMPPSQTQDLIYVGVLIPRKGVHLLLDAFGRLASEYPASHLWVAGSADNPQYAEGLKQQAARSGLEDRVTFTGKLAQVDLAHFMGRSRALVLPSSSEGLPRVIIEAMLSAMPVVATCISGIPDVIQDGVNGYLVPPEDARALEKALRAVLDNPGVDHMGQAGQNFARQFFSADVYASGYAALLSDAAQSLQNG